MPDDRGTGWTVLTAVTAAAVVVLAVAVVLGVVVPGVTTPGPTAETDSGDHENPESTTGEVDQAALEAELAARLQQQVQSGAVNLTQEDDELAREQLGDDNYEQLLEEYGDVASETGVEDRQQLLQRAQQAQVVYADLVATYWEQFETYEQRKNATEAENGTLIQDPTAGVIHEDNESLRTLARELERTVRNLTTTSEETIVLYEQLDAVTDEDYSTVIDSIADSRDSVIEAQETVRQEQFVRTNLTLTTTDSASISPVEPLEIEGRLTNAGGEPLSEVTVPLEIGGQTFQTTANETGYFAARYYPGVLPTNATEVTIRYAPANESIYLGDELTRNVTVSSATPTVSVAATPGRVSYNTTVAVNGTVRTAKATYGSVPYEVLLYGEPLAEGETAPNGTVRESVQVPAAVEPGDQELSVRLQLQGQALNSTKGTTSLAVGEIGTSVRVEAEPAGEELLAVSGRLVTNNGEAVPDQRVQLFVNGTAVGTAQTDETGEFAQQVLVPAELAANLDEGDAVEAEVVFDGSNTNLRSTRATALTPVTTETGGLVLPLWLLVPPGVLALLGAGYLLVTRRRRTPDSTRSDEVDGGPDAPAGAERDAPAYLEQAVDYLDEGQPAAAVQAGYAAVQRQLAEDRRPGQTHWEFYRSYHERLDDDARRALRRATEGYERATFAPTAVDTDTAREVLAAVDGLVPDDEPLPLDD